MNFSDRAKENQQTEIINFVINSSVNTERAFSGRKASELGSSSFASREGHLLHYLRSSWCSQFLYTHTYLER